MRDEKVKILVLGPSKSGKSTIANFLAGTRESPTKEYYETSPLRILEAEVALEGLRAGGRAIGGVRKAVVQLWDLGGSSKHQASWPAIAHKADGIIYVFNPEIRNAEKELLLWHKNFALDQDQLDDKNNFKARVGDTHCLIFAHHSTVPETAIGDLAIPTMPKQLKNVKAIETSLDYQSDNFKEAFDMLVERVIVSRIEAEEEEFLQKEREYGDTPRLMR